MSDETKKTDPEKVCVMEAPPETEKPEEEEVVYLDRNSILEIDDQKIIKVDVPEWGGAVYVKAISGAERDEFEVSITKNGKPDLSDFRGKIAALCCCHPDGSKMFAPNDAELLSKKSASALERIFDPATKLNGFTGKDIEDLAKNSDSVQNGDSGSSSQES